jgi:Na+-translocating ferredoxin:NAD+ oxidoreductase RnfG subunit
MKTPLTTLCILLCLITSSSAFAGGIYQEPAAFIDQVFDNKPPKAEVLWLDKALKEKIAVILDHNYSGLRVRYWRQDNKSAWVLEEIGKEKPITAGIVITDGKIEQLKILAFRESRGWEVRHDFFTNQFTHASLTDDQQLDKSIDNISGATLSVRAVSKLARIALLLDQQLH